MQYNNHTIWYAVMYDHDDNDHGTGYHDYTSAAQAVRRLRSDGYPDAHIDIVSEDDDYCYASIYDLDTDPIAVIRNL